MALSCLFGVPSSSLRHFISHYVVHCLFIAMSRNYIFFVVALISIAATAAVTVFAIIVLFDWQRYIEIK